MGPTRPRLGRYGTVSETDRSTNSEVSLEIPSSDVFQRPRVAETGDFCVCQESSVLEISFMYA